MIRRREFLQSSVAGAALATVWGCGEGKPKVEEATATRPKIEEAVKRIQQWVEEGKLSAASLTVTQRDFAFQRPFGRAKSPDDIFLLASITKPMTATGAMVLVDRGRLSLSDSVSKYIPEFNEGDRALITVKHLLTHSSGLPDQLPENIEIRKRLGPLSEFVKGTIKTPLLFKPGTQVKYTSMGLLLVAEVCERITKKPLREHLEEVLYRPLGMTRTALGLGKFQIADTMLSQAELAEANYGGIEGSNAWHWNSPYWRNLGAPWGGAHSTGPNLTKLLRYFLKPDDRVLKPETAASMIVNQNVGLNEPWGIGWAKAKGKYCTACSGNGFGHEGSTGTMCWADPEIDMTCVILTTCPLRVSNDALLRPVSDLVAESAA